ncbi:hypothetical protein [Ochrobactrum sp. MC-1LL]|nr:hypothetical protein [Ochrobactrum sp. MC-1LL]
MTIYNFIAILFTLAIVSVAAAFLMLCHLERMADIARNEVDV